ncbi:MAG: hypothetical protein WCF24_08550 [Acidimicrobiales bacterium]
MLIDAPKDFLLDDPPTGCSAKRVRLIQLQTKRGNDPPDVTMAFVRDRSELDVLVQAVANSDRSVAPLWLCWPRRAGGHESDLTDNLVRAAGLSLGLVDTKVAAVNADWSGLRFSRRRT